MDLYPVIIIDFFIWRFVVNGSQYYFHYSVFLLCDSSVYGFRKKPAGLVPVQSYNKKLLQSYNTTRPAQGINAIIEELSVTSDLIGDHFGTFKNIQAAVTKTLNIVYVENYQRYYEKWQQLWTRWSRDNYFRNINFSMYLNLISITFSLLLG